MKRNKVAILAMVLVCMALASTAFAFTAPASTDIMYKVYDLVVVKMIGGGITYIIGFVGLCSAAFILMQQKIVPAIFIIVGSIIFLSAGSMATAFGLTLF